MDKAREKLQNIRTKLSTEAEEEMEGVRSIQAQHAWRKKSKPAANASKTCSMLKRLCMKPRAPWERRRSIKLELAKYEDAR